MICSFREKEKRKAGREDKIEKRRRTWFKQ